MKVDSKDLRATPGATITAGDSQESQGLRELPTSEERVTHELKCWTEFFPAVLDGSKPFEIREDDRDYAVGHYLRLREWERERMAYTGREVTKRITYVTDFAQRCDYVVLGLAEETNPLGRDADWVLALGHALGLDSGFDVPIVPEVESVKRLLAEVRRRASQTKARLEIPAILFDSYRVLQALSDKAKKRTSPENLCDVMDAMVRVLRAEKTDGRHAALTHSSAQTKCEKCGEDIGHSNHIFEAHEILADGATAEICRHGTTYAACRLGCPPWRVPDLKAELHDDRCAKRRGYPCNCASAAFERAAKRAL